MQKYIQPRAQKLLIDLCKLIIIYFSLCYLELITIILYFKLLLVVVIDLFNTKQNLLKY